MSRGADASPMPGREILGWVPLSAILLEAANDLYLRYAYPGWLTGKLSDVAALVWVPVFLYSCMAISEKLLGRWIGSDGSSAVGAKVFGNKRAWALATTLIVYSAINTFPLAADVYASAIDVLDPRSNAFPHRYTCDLGDLVCLPALMISNSYLKKIEGTVREGWPIRRRL